VSDEVRRADVTRILEAARLGDAAAAEEVLPLLYDELRGLARARMGSRLPAHTLQPTALVHEVYLRIMDRDASWESRAHFFGVAAKAMRSVLVDHARARRARKRGGDREREPLHEAVAWFEERSIDLVALSEALDRLQEQDPRKRRLVELRFFAGLTTAEAAEMLGVSVATAERDWALARAWLRRELGGSRLES
jgi:RNA polymerase sigma factor (TIGR02999 family)